MNPIGTLSRSSGDAPQVTAPSQVLASACPKGAKRGASGISVRGFEDCRAVARGTSGLSGSVWPRRTAEGMPPKKGMWGDVTPRWCAGGRHPLRLKYERG
jgi:hypothetical protein